MAVQDLARIEERLDKAVAGAVEVSDSLGGVLFRDMAQVMEFAKLLSLAGTAVPKHLRGNPGACLAVTIQALEWRMSPVAVANKSYEVNDRIAYEAQLIHGVVEARAPLKQRLRFRFSGEGDDLRCTVIGHFRGEVDPVEYESPPVGEIKVKNSPLWRADVRQQLTYYSVRAWARRHCPDVLLGIYSEDELDRDDAEARAADVTPRLSERLKGAKGKRGFQTDNVAALEHKSGEAVPPTPLQPEPVPVAAETPLASRPSLSAAAAGPSEPEMTFGADLVAEVQDKTHALSRCKSEDEIAAIVEGVTELLRGHNRNDLLADFLDAAKKATDRVGK